MSGENSNPPRLALWWLRHACPASDKDALTGDLIERFREGQTRGWFWRQVFVAFLVGVAGEIRRHWPHFCYAIAGTLMILVFAGAPGIRDLPRWLRWYDLPWPWDQAVAELSGSFLGVLAALSVLAAGLVIERSFRWVSLVRTAVISLTLITFGHYSLDLCPWLLRPAPGDQTHKFLIIPVTVVIGFCFSSFLAAAWLGCRSWSRREIREAPVR